MFQVENREDLGDVDFMKEPVKEFAEDECEDQNFISEDKVMVKHELDDVNGDDLLDIVRRHSNISKRVNLRTATSRASYIAFVPISRRLVEISS